MPKALDKSESGRQIAEIETHCHSYFVGRTGIYSARYTYHISCSFAAFSSTDASKRIRTMERRSMSELSEDCLSVILSFASPREICMLSTISKSFLSASDSDDIWSKFLPPPDQLRQILALSGRRSMSFKSKKQLYFHLSNTISSADHNMLIWVEKQSGSISCMISARKLSIAWASTDTFWHWLPVEKSRFLDSAVLKEVCRFEVKGFCDCRILSLNVKYRVSFVVKMENVYGWNLSPVKFLLKTPDGEEIKSERYFIESHVSDSIGNINVKETPLLEGQDGWRYLVVGEFRVIPEWFINHSEERVCVTFKMWEWNSSWWKHGLIVDGARIEALCY